MHRSSGTMKVTTLGKKILHIKNGGKTKNVVIQPVKFCASAKVNLLSITALLSQGSIFTKELKNNILLSIENEK